MAKPSARTVAEQQKTSASTSANAKNLHPPPHDLEPYRPVLKKTPDAARQAILANGLVPSDGHGQHWIMTVLVPGAGRRRPAPLTACKMQLPFTTYLQDQGQERKSRKVFGRFCVEAKKYRARMACQSCPFTRQEYRRRPRNKARGAGAEPQQLQAKLRCPAAHGGGQIAQGSRAAAVLHRVGNTDERQAHKGGYFRSLRRASSAA